MSDSRLAQELRIDAIYPNHGVPPRPGEDRPGLSPFGRLAMGGAFGKSSILIYDARKCDVQEAGVDMLTIQGDDLDACQLNVTLHPPRVIPIDIDNLPLATQNLTGELSNAEVGCISWPPLEALIEWGVGGVSAKAVVDYVNGVTLSVIASYLRVSAIVTQSKDCGDIYGTSAAYYLAAHVGPGNARANAHRTIFVGLVDHNVQSDVFDVPRFAKFASLSGCSTEPTPVISSGFIRFYQDPSGKHGIGDFYVADHQNYIEIPNGAMYFNVFNMSGHEMKMSVIFELSI
jgi:hypothetical protein